MPTRLDAHLTLLALNPRSATPCADRISLQYQLLQRLCTSTTGYIFYDVFSKAMSKLALNPGSCNRTYLPMACGALICIHKAFKL